MKKTILVIGIISLLVLTSTIGATVVISNSEIEGYNLSEREVEDKQLSQALDIQIGKIEEMLYDAIESVDSLSERIVLKNRISNKFDMLHSAGMTNEMTLRELLLDGDGELLVTSDGKLIETNDFSPQGLFDIWDMISRLLDIFNFNFLCDVDVDMDRGWIMQPEDNETVRIIIGKEYTKSDRIINDMVDEAVYDFIDELIPPEKFPRINKFLRNVYFRMSDRMSDFILENTRYSTQRIQVLLGLQVDDEFRVDGNAFETYGDPVLIFDNGLIARLLPDFYNSSIRPYIELGRQSYHLRGRAGVVIGI
jgi:hypothetical protein